MTSTTDPRQLRLDGVLLMLDGFLLTVVALDWSPGIFFKHVENVRIDVAPKKQGFVAKISTIGGPIPHEVLRVPVPADQLPAFQEFVAEAKEARERSLRVTPGSAPVPR